MKRILRPGSNCMGVYEVRKSGLIVDGQNYYRAFYEAARRAERYILLCGWQFDSDVALLRGKDAEGAGAVRLLPFLKKLCEEKPELNIYILAWDFASIYLIDREWFQQWVFTWTSRDRIHFRFDDRHAVGASHHQKFAVIDGAIAFAGGLDICANRWDDRRHLSENPERKTPAGTPYEPFHDTQSFHAGPAAQALADLFKALWENSGGEALDLPPYDGDYGFEVPQSLPVEAAEVAISRTTSRTIVPPTDPVREIRGLYADAISAAERLIYIENQYFTSEAVHRALTDRLRARGRTKLQVVLVLPKTQNTVSEAIALGLVQAKMLKSLKDTALGEGGHSIGIYYCLSEPKESETPVYIHSKLMVVDDTFMTVGSANTTNRSMGLDTELNVAWEASEGQEALKRSIRAVRLSLLREHAGVGEEEDFDFDTLEGLTGGMDALADSRRCRLRRHTLEAIIDERFLPGDFKPEELMLDPEKPIVEENVFELLSQDQTGIFAQGITALSDLLVRDGNGMAKRTLHFLLRHLWAALLVVLLLALGLWFALK